MQHIRLVDDLHELGNRGALLRIPDAKPAGIQIHVGKKAVEDRIGSLDVIEGLFQVLALEFVVRRLLCQRVECKTRLNHIPAGVPQIVQQIRGVLAEISFFISALGFLDALRLTVFDEVIRFHQERIRQIFIENKAQEIILIFVCIHLGAQDIRPCPQDRFQFFSAFAHCSYSPFEQTDSSEIIPDIRPCFNEILDI